MDLVRLKKAGADEETEKKDERRRAASTWKKLKKAQVMVKT
jgi:hypothetical protein